MRISKTSRDHLADEIFILHLHIASEHSRLFPQFFKVLHLIQQVWTLSVKGNI